MNCSAMASVFTRRCTNFTRSVSSASSCTMDALEIPSDECSVRLFTISGNASWRGRFTFNPIGNAWNAGTRMRWYTSSFLESDFSREIIRPRGLHPVYGTRSSSSRLTTFWSKRTLPWNSSSRLNATSGLNSSTASRIGCNSSCTPSARTSWPSCCRVLTTSYSVLYRKRSSSDSEAASGGGTRSGCISASTRSFFIASQGDPVAPPLRIEEVHGFHREQHREVHQQFTFRAADAQRQVATAADHVVEHHFERVLILTRPTGDEPADFTLVAPEE